VRIYDDLYGLIDFDDLVIRDIVDTKIFQRLRRIRQLALAEYVFPGATHTRFSHSLGAAHLMRRITENPKFKRKISRSQRKLLIRAALLHDIGHLPLSHSLEGVYRRQLEEKKKKTKRKTETLGSVEMPSELEKRMGESEQVHEAISSYIVESPELRGIIGKHETEEISQILRGDHDRLLFNQLMHSHMDIDTIDYLRRDAKTTGIKYGEFDDSYLVGNIYIRKLGDKEVLCVDSHAIHTVEHYILAKYFYYLQILYHKIRLGYELLAEVCAYWMIKKRKLPSVENLQEWIDDGRFVTLDDCYFMQTLRQMHDHLKLPASIKGLFSVLLNRQHFSVEYEQRLVYTKINDEDWEVEKRELIEKVRYCVGELSKTNLLEDESITIGAPNYFPISVEKREIYPLKEVTEQKASEQGAVMPVQERDTIKILFGNGMRNVNSVDNSVIEHLSGYTTVLVRYYYIPKDRMG